MSDPIAEDDLHAFADGQLDAARRTQVEAWLAAHPEHRASVDTWREQSAALHAAYDTVLDEPIPARLNALKYPAARWLDGRIAAAVAWLTLGLLVGYGLGASHDSAKPTAIAASLPRQAAVAHAVYVPEVKHPVEVGVEQEAHLVAWLSKRLGSELKPPKLDAAGYLLVGGRLLPGERAGVAQFMYENAAHNRLTLYVQPNGAGNTESAFRYSREGNVDVFYWVDGPFGYALSGNTGREDMLRLANLAYRKP